MLKSYIHALIIAIVLLIPSISHAADGACAKVVLEIAQELTVERVAFDAKLVLTNNLPDKNLTDIRVDVQIKDGEGNLKNDLFFMKMTTPEYAGFSDGSGVVKASTRAEVHWLIIPSPGAGGEDLAGINYFAGAKLTYTVAEKVDTVDINPDQITVRPTAQLVLDYFTPYQVIADNPFTQKIEPPVPFELAVRVMNDGFGPANKLKIESAQPKIVENDQGLLVDFRLLGASVNDSEVSTSLTVNMGNVASKSAATGYWEMITTLSGRFEAFDVSFSHSDDLGGELTSLIRETNAHYLVHRVKANQANRDNLLDFLADTDRDEEHLPDALFESEIPGASKDMEDAKSTVHIVQATNTPARPTNDNPETELKTSNAEDAGWTYVKLPDPSNGMLNLLDVVRKDGTHLDPHNFWVDKKLDDDYKDIYTLQLLDYRESNLVDGTYTLVYEEPDEDITPPVTTLIYDGYAYAGDAVVIPPSTRVVFKATDNDGGSGVDYMMKKEDGKDANFVPALPFNFTDAGSYSIEYYSVDAAGNTEETKTTQIVVDDSAPEITVFGATPASIIPHAPEGISAARSTVFNVNATDNVSKLPVKIEISRGETFSPDTVVKTIEGEINSGMQDSFGWDGTSDDGKLVPTGKYTARVTVRDSLGDNSDSNHSSTRTASIELAEWFAGDSVANGDGEQMHPAVSGTRVVWQDDRTGNWDIYYRDLADGAEVAITSNAADQTDPDVDGNIVVWQDSRGGGTDIYGYNTATGGEFAISMEAGVQAGPVVSGDWVAWQDSNAGNWDIYAYNISTMEKIRITSHERGQMNPSIEGNTILWQDYRHGLGEIYSYDLAARTETRLTTNIDNQTSPAIYDDVIVWTDHRNGGRDIYMKHTNGERRVTYGTGDQADAVIRGGTIIYTDYEKGLDDPNLAFYDLATGLGGILIADPARQEEPAIGDGYVVWQDNREGKYRIYSAEFEVEAVPVKARIRPGFNLIAVGEGMASQYATASALVAAYGESFGIERAMALDAMHGTYAELEYDGTRTGGEDFALVKGMAIVVYAAKEGTMTVAESGETVKYTLLPGANEIGMLTVPGGYRAYDLLRSVGVDNIQSVRRFNAITGSWETAAVMRENGTSEIVGVNFELRPGEGLAITMIERVDGWKP